MSIVRLGAHGSRHLYTVEVWLKGGTASSKRVFEVYANDREHAGRIAVRHCATEGEAREVASVNMIA